MERSNPFNQFSQIPYYEGARIEDWDSLNTILNDEPSVFYWNYNYNVDYRNNLWVADKRDHTIYYISKEVETWNAIFKVAGSEGIAGARDGNIQSSSFNSPESLFVYEKSAIGLMEDKNLKPIWLKYPDKAGCLYATYNNYTECGVLIDENFPYPIVDHKRVKYIPFVSGMIPEFFQRDGEQYIFDYQEPREVYISDTGNHCIRRLTVRQANVDTVAGVCGQPGNQDGVFSLNKLNKPTMIGMDKIGNMFIYDSGNKKFRMLDTDRIMHTLIDGACREDNTMPILDPPFDLQIRGTVCYKKWRTNQQKEDFNFYPGQEEAEEEVEEEDK